MNKVKKQSLKSIEDANERMVTNINDQRKGSQAPKSPRDSNYEVVMRHITNPQPYHSSNSMKKP